MKIVNKSNFLIILCCSYAVISLSDILLTLLSGGVLEDSQKNSLLILVVSTIAIFMLSQHYRLDNLPLPIAMLTQYIVFIVTIEMLLWISAFYEKPHPDGFRDLFVSGTAFYIIGAIVYYISLFVEVRKQNSILKEIKNRYKE